ncbi:MAG: hypothetical protein B7Z80_23510 [Rhodospirillales bacterium 20-64-7]|nr:MAG: hypothetical protein B7Z80_23510 [Rhodospirillales bacterium 20-64-7]
MDVSGSAAEPGTLGRTVHEQQRAVVADLTVALHDLGDRVALYAYYSQGRAAVNMLPIKRFDDHVDARFIRRLNSLEPGAYSRLGAAMQAIRDDEAAALSVGVPVQRAKRVMFVLAGFGAGLAGTVWLATSISFQPNTYFGVQWTAYMIFMTLVGGIGTFEGPILGAVLFFAVESAFGAEGVWYLIGIGVAAVAFALFLPQGFWGWLERRYALRLLPVGYVLKLRGVDAGRQRGFARGPSAPPPAAFRVSQKP